MVRCLAVIREMVEILWEARIEVVTPKLAFLLHSLLPRSETEFISLSSEVFHYMYVSISNYLQCSVKAKKKIDLIYASSYLSLLQADLVSSIMSKGTPWDHYIYIGSSSGGGPAHTRCSICALALWYRRICTFRWYHCSHFPVVLIFHCGASTRSRTTICLHVSLFASKYEKKEASETSYAESWFPLQILSIPRSSKLLRPTFTFIFRLIVTRSWTHNFRPARLNRIQGILW